MARSAAFVLAIVVVLSFIVGAFMLTVTDPVIQSFFDSTLGSADTQDGSNLISWLGIAWATLPAVILIGLLLKTWVSTRRPA
jgi:cytochrome c oxidase assembly factor CtaG